MEDSMCRVDFANVSNSLDDISAFGGPGDPVDSGGSGTGDSGDLDPILGPDTVTVSNPTITTSFGGKASYEEYRDGLIQQRENPSLFNGDSQPPILVGNADNQHVTVGFGYDVTNFLVGKNPNPDKVLSDFDKAGIPLTNQQMAAILWNAGVNRDDILTRLGSSASQADQDFVNNLGANDQTADGLKKNLGDLLITKDQGQALYDSTIAAKEKALDNYLNNPANGIPQNVRDALGANPDLKGLVGNNDQRAVLVDLAYQGLLGPRLAVTLATGDTQATAIEIAFLSNGRITGSTSGGADGTTGIDKRNLDRALAFAGGDISPETREEGVSVLAKISDTAGLLGQNLARRMDDPNISSAVTLTYQNGVSKVVSDAFAQLGVGQSGDSDFLLQRDGTFMIRQGASLSLSDTAKALGLSSAGLAIVSGGGLLAKADYTFLFSGDVIRVPDAFERTALQDLGLDATGSTPLPSTPDDISKLRQRFEGELLDVMGVPNHKGDLANPTKYASSDLSDGGTLFASIDGTQNSYSILNASDGSMVVQTFGPTQVVGDVTAIPALSTLTVGADGARTIDVPASATRGQTLGYTLALSSDGRSGTLTLSGGSAGPLGVTVTLGTDEHGLIFADQVTNVNGAAVDAVLAGQLARSGIDLGGIVAGLANGRGDFAGAASLAMLSDVRQGVDGAVTFVGTGPTSGGAAGAGLQVALTLGTSGAFDGGTLTQTNGDGSTVVKTFATSGSAGSFVGPIGITEGTSLNGFDRTVLQLMINVALDGDENKAFQLSKAGATSGYGIGVTQHDLVSENPLAPESGPGAVLLRTILTGSGQFDSDTVSGIVAALTDPTSGVASDPFAGSGLTDVRGGAVSIQSLNALLQTDSAKAAITAEADRAIQRLVTSLDNVLANVQDAAVRNAILNDPVAPLALIDLDHKFPIQPDGKFVQFLNGAAVSLNNNTVTLQRSSDLSKIAADIFSFELSTQEASNPTVAKDILDRISGDLTTARQPAGGGVIRPIFSGDIDTPSAIISYGSTDSYTYSQTTIKKPDGTTTSKPPVIMPDDPNNNTFPGGVCVMPDPPPPPPPSPLPDDPPPPSPPPDDPNNDPNNNPPPPDNNPGDPNNDPNNNPPPPDNNPGDPNNDPNNNQPPPDNNPGDPNNNPPPDNNPPPPDNNPSDPNNNPNNNPPPPDNNPPPPDNNPSDPNNNPNNNPPPPDNNPPPPTPDDNTGIGGGNNPFNRSMGDPIVLDLGGNGVQLTSLQQSKAFFDLHGDGFAVHTAWVGPQTGFLVSDPNHTGQVNSIHDLFGSDTTDGFTALRALDTNNDGVIDAKDAAFSSLAVWVDANGNGVVDAGELKSLAARGIASIDLSTKELDKNVNGNVIGEVGSFTRTDGTSGQVAEAFFNNDQIDSTFTGSFRLNPAVLSLPNIRGYGTVPALYIAMSLDPTLLQMVQNLSSETVADAASFGDQVQAIIYRWAGVDNVAPGSRGSFVDAQHLAALEKIFGEQWQDNFGHGGANPSNAHQGETLESAWDSAFAVIASRLLVQGPLASLFSNVRYNFNTDRLEGNADIPALVTAIGQAAPTDPEQAAAYFADRKPLIEMLATNVGANFFDVGPGDQTINGRAGNNIYLFNVGDGHQTIVGDGGGNTLMFGAGISASDLIFQSNGRDLDITFRNSPADSIHISQDMFGGGAQVQSALFADGSKLDLLHPMITNSGAGDGDVVVGKGSGATNLFTETGGGGSHTLIGGNGSNVYHFNVGDGRDTIVANGGSNALSFGAGIGAGDVTFQANGNDLEIVFAGNAADSIHVADNFLGGSDQIQTATFADGTTLDLTQLTFTGADTPSDTLVGGAGTDTVIGTRAAMTLLAGTGTETLEALRGGAHLQGGEGLNNLIAYGDGSTLQAGTGATMLTATGDHETLVGGDGTDVLAETGNYSSLQAGNGDNTLSATGWFNTLSAGDATDTLTATGTHNALFGGSGTSVLIAEGDFNTLTVGSGQTSLEVHGRGNTLIGGAGADILQLGPDDGANVLLGGAGNDTLTSESAGADLEGGAGDDVITGVDDSILRGGDGNDTLNLTGDFSIVDGGAGDDVLHVTGDHNTLFGGEGHDTLTLYGERNTLIAGSGSSTLTAGGEYNTLIAGGGDNILTLTPGVDGGDGLIQGGLGNDTLIDYSGAKLIAGDGAHQTLMEFNGYAALIAGAGDDVVTVEADYEGIRAASGTLEAMLTGDHNSLAGGSGQETVSATGDFNTLAGGSGSVTLTTSGYANTLTAGGGDDVLTLNAGTNGGGGMLQGGLGNDTLISNAGGAVLVAGDGARQTLEEFGINSFLTAGAGDDVVTVEGSYVSVQAGGGTLEATLTGDHNSLTGGTGQETVTSTGDFNTLEGGSGSVALTTSGYANTLIAGSGDDVLTLNPGTNGGGGMLQGGLGNDTLISNAGGAVLVAGDGAHQTLSEFGINSFLTAGAGDDVVTVEGSYVSVQAGSGTLEATLTGDHNSLAGGSGQETVSVTGDFNTLAGGSGGITLTTNGYANTLIAGGGDDVLTLNPGTNGGGGMLQGGLGNDTLISNVGGAVLVAGDGTHQTLEEFGINSYLTAGAGDDVVMVEGSYVSVAAGSGTLEASLTGDHNSLAVGSGREVATATGDFNVLVAGDAGASLEAHGTGNTLTGGAGNDVLHIGSENGGNLLQGGGGDDTLIAESGGAVLDGGAGNDVITGVWYSVLLGGDGNDTITAIGDYSSLDGGAGDDTLNATGVHDTLSGGTGHDTLVSHGDFNVLMAGDDGSSLEAHGTGNTLTGGAGNDVLRIGAENGGNVLQGGGGDDTLIAESGGAVLDGGAGNDVITGVWYSVLLGGDGNDTITAAGDYSSLDGGAGDDTLNATGAHDTLSGGAGHDTLVSHGDFNVLMSGNDGSALAAYGTGNTLTGGAGADILVAGSGSNTLIAGAGNETFEFGRGSGAATIENGSGNRVDAANTLMFGGDIAVDQLWLARSNMDLQVNVIGSSDIVTIADWFGATANHVASLETADGSVLADTRVDQLISAMASFAPPTGTDTHLQPDVEQSLAPALAAAWQQSQA